MGASNSESLQEQLKRAKKTLERTGKSVDRLIAVLEPTEQMLMRKEFQTRTVLDPGQAKVVLCLEEELASSKSFRKAISKLSMTKPTLVKIPEDRNSRLTNLTVARMIPVEVLTKSEGQVLVVNLQRELMLKQLEQTKSVVLGQRYYLNSNDAIVRLSAALESQGINVLEDQGLYGGSVLTYELVRTLEGRPQSTVLEITLSKSVAENTNILKRVLESLLSL
ncbi:MAG: hypothetical protein P1Q69_16085 [Candidatus Thorarchaeota archaeon]|nr:hypothetical protein [Candidatus Thorarchaeota archaeon]